MHAYFSNSSHQRQHLHDFRTASVSSGMKPERARGVQPVFIQSVCATCRSSAPFKIKVFCHGVSNTAVNMNLYDKMNYLKRQQVKTDIWPYRFISM